MVHTIFTLLFSFSTIIMFSGCSDDMSCSDSDDSLQKAFPVPLAEEGEDLSAPPMTGEQYLRRVM